MKFKDECPLATPEAAEQKLLEIANAIEADHAGAAASVWSGSAIPRLNGAGSLSRSDLIRNSFGASPKSQIAVPPKVGIAGAIAVGLRAQSRLPGTEFLDAETGRQKSSRKRANACRDQSPGSEWPENPVETPYLAPYRKRIHG